MANNVTASLEINFGGITDAYLSAEINSEDNDGKTSYVAGDEVYFRIYHSGNYTVASTAGSCALETANITANIKTLTDGNTEEVVKFAFSATASTDKLITNFISYTWMGTALGVIKKSGYNEVSGGTATGIGVAKIDYDTTYDLWKFSSPATVNGSTDYSVVIGITAVI